MEVEVQYLQRSVDLLYHFLRLLGDDQGSQEIDVVQWHLANLQSRIPGLKDVSRVPPRGRWRLGSSKSVLCALMDFVRGRQSGD